LSHLCASVAHESASSTPATSGPQPRACRGPQPERAVDVGPRPGLVRDLADLADGIDRAGVDVAELSAHDRWPAPLTQTLPQRRRAHAPLPVHRDRGDRGRAQPEEAQCPVDSVVALLAGQHSHAGRTGQPVGLDVPADPAERLVAAAAKAVKLACCTPVTNPTDTSAGRPSSSASQPPNAP
jgi:hypothetical protein